jgi:hypothetical protein
MISDSWHWKVELNKLLNEFHKWGSVWADSRTSSSRMEAARFRLERATFFSALAIRRLIESRKVTNALEGKALKVNFYSCKVDGYPNLSSYHWATDLREWIDFSRVNTTTIGPKDLVSEIIHSFILDFYIDENERVIDGIWIASERNAFIRVLDLGVSTWSELVRRCIAEDVTEVRATYDPEKKRVTEHRR